MRARAIDRVGQRIIGLGRPNNNRIGLPIQPPDCELPENPFSEINASNPSSWYNGITNFMSGLFKAQACTEDELANSITDPNSNADPNKSIFKKFQISALLGRMYDLLKWVAEVTKQNREAQKDLNQLAFAAK